MNNSQESKYSVFGRFVCSVLLMTILLPHVKADNAVKAVNPTPVFDFYSNGVFYKKNDDGKSVSVFMGLYTNYGQIYFSYYTGDVVVPEVVEYGGKEYVVTAVSIGAFMGSKEMTRLWLPATIEEIGIDAFSSCTGLTEIFMWRDTPPSTSSDTFKGFDCSKCALWVPMGSISAYKGNSRWKNFKSITEYYSEMNAGWLEIDGIFYRYNSNQDEMHVTYKGDDFYSYYDEYKGDVIIPESVIYNNADYPVAEIADYAFTWCRNLTSVTIPQSVSKIGYRSFHYCDKLSSVIIPSSVKSIGSMAFANCGLTSMVNLAISPQDINEDVFSNVNKSKCKLYVPIESVNLYKAADVWKEFSIQGINGVDGIYDDNQAKTIVGYYDVQGRCYNEPIRGINIVRYSDGSSKKIIHK